MNKKIIVIIVSIIMVLITIFSFFIIYRANSKNKIGEKVETEISEVIFDECTDEYENMEEEIIKTNAAIDRGEKASYVLRENNGKISIYKINKDGKEELYEETKISIEYLPDADKRLISNGVKVEGKEELNELIESFE